MPRDINGNYTLPSSVNPVVADTLIESTWANTTLNDVASSMTDSLARAGTGGMTGPLGLVDGSLVAPALSFTNDPNSGIAALAVNTISLVADGAEVFRADAAKITFVLPPTWGVTPTAAGHLVNKAYADNLAFSAALPAQAGSAGKLVGTDGTTASWQDVYGTATVLTTTPGAALTARNSYALDSTAGAFNVTLPLAPTDRDWVRLMDIKGDCDVRYVTVIRNGQNIMGLAQNLDIDIEFFSGVFTYYSSYGWVIQ